MGMKAVFLTYRLNYIFVHGETTTTFAAAFYEKIAVGHIDVDLKTGNIYSPCPKEVNRKLTSQITHYHFTPTIQSQNNLLNENIAAKQIIITGNTVIDALLLMKNKLETDAYFRNKIHTSITQKYFDPEKSEFILVTGHRRENFGEGFINICNALKTIALQRLSINIAYPVHLIPDVSNPVYSLLSEIEKPSSLVWDSLSRPILMTFESHPPYR